MLYTCPNCGESDEPTMNGRTAEQVGREPREGDRIRCHSCGHVVQVVPDGLATVIQGQKVPCPGCGWAVGHDSRCPLFGDADCS